MPPKYIQGHPEHGSRPAAKSRIQKVSTKYNSHYRTFTNGLYSFQGISKRQHESGSAINANNKSKTASHEQKVSRPTLASAMLFLFTKTIRSREGISLLVSQERRNVGG